MTRGKRFAVLRQGERIDGKEHEEILGAQRGYDGPCIQFQAYRDGLSVEWRAQGLAPRINRLGAVFEYEKLPSRSASSLEANIVLSLRQSRPTKAAKVSSAWGFLCALPGCGTGVPRDMPAGVLRRHDREPVTRQPLSIR
jgi:hypothetical protein